ncbi:hypothetical protein BGW36DRAFT_433091 [Talaromyces proteolyticus]|uniref:NmrA-like domain-containing protein n=1 Tax=Talaromyces proteolyticus TaxID=1131652 RepID=A0AAD4KE72_9EURO|nr:uncharacterized protein BGW36DRAFT_433091 [Talaromyces proteolyticus]KAH8690137.1 hypothetical protein BGW36DRAFT_433091 [Talaromyces proteolyticus]
MTIQYAKNQPAGFKNRIERVAIIGASGQVGRPITDALLQTGKHIVTVITRSDSQNKLPEGVKVAQVNYEEEATLVEALKGQQVLIISLAVTAAPDTQAKIISAAAKAGVPHVMPNAWGGDTQNKKLAAENLTGEAYLAGIQNIEDSGIFWTNLCCSFWYEYSLALPFAYGFDVPNKKVTFYDDGNVRINTSTWQQCGRAVASFLSLKALPEDENDKSPTVSAWHNKSLYVSSFLLSQREMLDSIQRVQGTTDADWQITHEPVVERYKRGLDMLQAGDRNGFGIALYARTFFPGGDGDYEHSRGLDNDILGLPKEDLDKATARSLHMSGSDWNPFASRTNAKIYD